MLSRTTRCLFKAKERASKKYDRTKEKQLINTFEVLEKEKGQMETWFENKQNVVERMKVFSSNGQSVEVSFNVFGAVMVIKVCSASSGGKRQYREVPMG